MADLTDQDLNDAETEARALMAAAAELDRAQVELARLAAAARKVVAASEGVRLPLDTGRDTPGEELWGALLELRAVLAPPLNLNPPLCGCRLPADVCDGSWPACRAPTPASPEETHK